MKITCVNLRFLEGDVESIWECQVMNSRERVLTAFEHQEPDRVPCWCGASEEFWAKAKN